MDQEKFIKPITITKSLGITYKTLWNWIKSGKIKTSKGLTGRYLIPESELLRLKIIKPTPIDKISIIYARVSNTKQKEDLNRQIIRLSNYASAHNIKIDETLHDIGSGMNFNRKNFQKIIKLIAEQKIDVLLIEHKDRLSRFAFEIFNSFSVLFNFKIIITCSDPLEIEPFEKELTQDLISIIHHFSMKLYSNRRKEFKLLAEKLKNGNR
jgi:Predicted site-specific integrase-resolvase